MAIQINERDQLIFKIIDEHKVLLEKHIAWFIAPDDKPVLIRDRLRKLFYLDYLLCQRHGTKLPWWTTPTKPLVYMLSPMSKHISGTAEDTIDLLDSNVQRHLLEVANIKMLGLMAQQAGEMNNFNWVTHVGNTQTTLDATMTFRANDRTYKIAVVNHPNDKEQLLSDLDAHFADNSIDRVLIVCRDNNYQESLQKFLTEQSKTFDLGKIFFATHQELYKSSITRARYLNVHRQSTTFPSNTLNNTIPLNINLSHTQAASA
jgi:hypothetical protein